MINHKQFFLEDLYQLSFSFLRPHPSSSSSSLLPSLPFLLPTCLPSFLNPYRLSSILFEMKIFFGPPHSPSRRDTGTGVPEKDRRSILWGVET